MNRRMCYEITFFFELLLNLLSVRCSYASLCYDWSQVSRMIIYHQKNRKSLVLFKVKFNLFFQKSLTHQMLFSAMFDTVSASRSSH